MVYCAAYGCTNRLKKGNGLSFFKFPKDGRRAVWENFCKRSGFVATDNNYLCSDHFTLGQFKFHPKLLENLGLSFTKKCKLKEDAIPDVPLIVTGTCATSSNGRSSSSPSVQPSPRSAAMKRQRIQILTDAFREYDSERQLEETSDETETPQVQCTSSSATPTQDSGSQCEQNLSTKSVQANLKPVKPPTRVRRIQVDIPVSQCSVGIQCNLINAPALCNNDDMEIDESFSDEDDCNNTYDAEFDPDWEQDSDMEDDDDDYEMGDSDNDDDFCDMNYQLSSEDNITTEKQFLVSESCLQNLLAVCRHCKSACQTFISYSKGTMICTASVCSAGHIYEWKSQNSHKCMPWSNLLVASAIFYSGGSFAKVKQLFNNMNLQMFCKRTFLYIQSAYLTPAVLQVWDSTKNDMFSARSGKTVVLGGDGRCDSPGYSAKYGSYSLMDLDTNTVLDVQLVQSNEVKGSTHMELEGLKRGLDCMKREQITVGTLVTDRHVMVKKYMREEEPDTKHHFDVWHVSKGVTKKLEACAKKKGGEDIRPWVKSASNHMYWTAMTSGDDGDLKVAKWNSLTNHIVNQHENHSEKFPSCQHGSNEREWLEKGSRPHKMVKAVVESPYLVRDIRKLSPLHQTYGLEVFHSVVNHFAPKSRHFFYPSMLARLYIAALHFNENSNKEKALTKDGKQKWQISYPKAKKGKEAVVKPCKTDPTYGYVALLVQAAVERRKELPNYHDATVDGRENLGPVPPPLTDAFETFDKHELISIHRSRFT